MAHPGEAAASHCAAAQPPSPARKSERTSLIDAPRRSWSSIATAGAVPAHPRASEPPRSTREQEISFTYARISAAQSPRPPEGYRRSAARITRRSARCVAVIRCARAYGAMVAKVQDRCSGPGRCESRLVRRSDAVSASSLAGHLRRACHQRRPCVTGSRPQAGGWMWPSCTGMLYGSPRQ